MTWRLIQADCVEAMREMPESSIDAVVTDPPYDLTSARNSRSPATEGAVMRGFMGLQWDGSGVAFLTSTWAEVFRVLKPGAHLVAFGGTRTYHRMVVAIEDAGFEVRDCLAWLYATGFPKSLNLKGCQCSEGESGHGDGDLRRVRQAVPDVPADVASGEGTALQSPLQRDRTWARVGASRSQGAGGVDRGQLRLSSGEDDRSEQSGVEGRGDAEASAGELPGRSVRASAAVGVADGPEGRLHHGAPAGDRGVVRTAADANGSSEPPGPRSLEQREGEPGTLADEPRPQARGAWPLCPRCGEPKGLTGWGTALKPAFEPIVLARKPLSEPNVAANVLEHGTGALNIDGCRIEGADGDGHWSGDDGSDATSRPGYEGGFTAGGKKGSGRWPANVVLDPEAAALLDEQTGELGSYRGGTLRSGDLGRLNDDGWVPTPAVKMGFGDTGGASRFFYCPKADREEREIGRPLDATEKMLRWSSGDESPGTFQAEGTNRKAWNHHPTVKPIELMRWLCRLVTPPGGMVLDPFTGSGSTGIAALREGFSFIGIERESEYVEIARARIQGDAPLFNVGAEVVA